MFPVELIASSFLDLISKQAKPECGCKRVIVIHHFCHHYADNFGCLVFSPVHADL